VYDMQSLANRTVSKTAVDSDFFAIFRSLATAR
jgi:hypothetical protein